MGDGARLQRWSNSTDSGGALAANILVVMLDIGDQQAESTLMQRDVTGVGEESLQEPTSVVQTPQSLMC